MACLQEGGFITERGLATESIQSPHYEADGYWRGFSGKGIARLGEETLPVLGRVSMDLTAVDVSAAPTLAEGDWLAFDYALPEAAARSGMSQYELLTGLGKRFARSWR